MVFPLETLHCHRKTFPFLQKNVVRSSAPAPHSPEASASGEHFAHQNSRLTLNGSSQSLSTREQQQQQDPLKHFASTLSKGQSNYLTPHLTRSTSSSTQAASIPLRPPLRALRVLRPPRQRTRREERCGVQERGSQQEDEGGAVARHEMRRLKLRSDLSWALLFWDVMEAFKWAFKQDCMGVLGVFGGSLTELAYLRTLREIELAIKQLNLY